MTRPRLGASEEDTKELLRISLSAAVPLWIMEYERLPIEEILALAPEASQYIAEHGDVIMYRGARKGETARAFNELAKGLAILSFAPGGVKFLGMHFEAKPRRA